VKADSGYLRELEALRHGTGCEALGKYFVIYSCCEKLRVEKHSIFRVDGRIEDWLDFELVKRETRV
jgi:hypothetical protein